MECSKLEISNGANNYKKSSAEEMERGYSRYPIGHLMCGLLLPLINIFVKGRKRSAVKSECSNLSISYGVCNVWRAGAMNYKKPFSRRNRVQY